MILADDKTMILADDKRKRRQVAALQRSLKRLSAQPLIMFFATNQRLAGRSASLRMKYGYQYLP